MSASAFDRWCQTARRRRSSELDFGCHWVCRDEASWLGAPLWRVSWIQDSGELYAAPLPDDVDWDIRDVRASRTCRVGPSCAPRRVGLVFAARLASRAEIMAYLAGWDGQPTQLGPLVNPQAACLLRRAASSQELLYLSDAPSPA